MTFQEVPVVVLIFICRKRINKNYLMPQRSLVLHCSWSSPHRWFVLEYVGAENVGLNLLTPKEHEEVGSAHA